MARDPALDLAAEAYPALAEAALVDRRMALKLMAASAALAAASGCSAPGGRKTLTAGPPPRDIATTLEQNGIGFGVMVRTVNGSPVKIEGHPDHVASLGRSNVFAQAALLTHYDPERLRTPIIDGRAADWAAARALIASLPRSGAGIHILVEPVASPTLERMVRRAAQAAPSARFYRHRALPLDPGPQPDFSADTIVSFGNDFLGPGPMQVANAAAWAEARRRGRETGRVPRLIVVESVPSLTGARADVRIAASPAEMGALAQAARSGGGTRLGPALADAGRVALTFGPESRLQVSGASRPSFFDGVDLAPVAALAQALEAGEVDTLLILGGDPVYSAPAALRLGERLRMARQVVHLGSAANATTRLAQHRLPEKSMLACWGDLRAFDGSVSLARPVTREAGLTAAELLALIAGERPDGQALVRATYGLEEADLNDLPGGIALPAETPRGVSPPPMPAPPLPLPPTDADAGFTLVFRPGAHVWDGSLADNAWAQELPDPITGLAWGNAATIAPADAERLGIADGDEIEITVAGAALSAPAKRLAGQAPGMIGLTLGYGHRRKSVGGDIGHDAGLLFDGARVRDGAAVRPTGRKLRLIYPNRPFRPGEAADAVRWVAPGGEVARAPADTPGFATPEYSGTKQWGMAIDLDACIGCNACTIACQAENNVPVVGPDEVAAGRVMHWIRVDRHEDADGVTAHQPVPCMHCETAPCEPVCPVEATSHSSEGLNQMTYQRCVGTRSCSNNCPYKVRRFNWFDYAADGAIPEAGQNPRVHIREKGVMEKCTYCVQRIEDARSGDADALPVTACQQACPTQAIVFGDIADPADAVAQARADPRGYGLLDGLNLKPRTTYLARVKSDG